MELHVFVSYITNNTRVSFLIVTITLIDFNVTVKCTYTIGGYVKFKFQNFSHN